MVLIAHLRGHLNDGLVYLKPEMRDDRVVEDRSVERSILIPVCLYGGGEVPANRNYPCFGRHIVQSHSREREQLQQMELGLLFYKAKDNH